MIISRQSGEISSHSSVMVRVLSRLSKAQSDGVVVVGQAHLHLCRHAPCARAPLQRCSAPRRSLRKHGQGQAKWWSDGVPAQGRALYTTSSKLTVTRPVRNPVQTGAAMECSPTQKVVASCNNLLACPFHLQRGHTFSMIMSAAKNKNASLAKAVLAHHFKHCSNCKVHADLQQITQPVQALLPSKKAGT